MQRTDDWYKARLGKVTASSLYKVMAKEGTALRADYMMDLLCERLTGKPVDNYTNEAMQRGIDLEPKAKAMYELITGNTVKQVGLIDHPVIQMFGASPDGLIDIEGNLEIKCPKTSTHVDFLLTGEIDKKYLYQTHAQMMCAERIWTDFVSYDDRLPPGLDYKCVRIERDDELVKVIEEGVIKFLTALDKLETTMRAKQ